MNTELNTKRGKLLTATLIALAGAGVQQAVAGPEFQVGEQGSMQITYALQMMMEKKEYTSANDDGDSFDTFLRRNRVTFSGQYNDYIGFYAQFEAGNDSKNGNDDRGVYYRDAYLTLDKSDAVRFIAGRYKNTFSRENLEACLEPLTMDRSSLLAYSPYGASRDTGVTMWGNLLDAKLQYRIGVNDGREGEAVVKDNPRITGRVHASLIDPEYNYGYRGTYLGTQTVLTIGAAVDMQKDIAYDDNSTRTGSKDYRATTYDIFYEQPFSFGTVTTSAAVFDYSLDGYAIIADPTLSPYTEREGNYLKMGYMLPNPVGQGRLQLFARNEQVEYDEGTGLSNRSLTALGAHYYINGQSLKVSLEHASHGFDIENDSDASLQDHKQTTLSLQMIF
ncbi:MAG: porin [Gammaproteobacteria bacterium]|nr:porin [Gammaproteobacteria bacterium]